METMYSRYFSGDKIVSRNCWRRVCVGCLRSISVFEFHGFSNFSFLSVEMDEFDRVIAREWNF